MPLTRDEFRTLFTEQRDALFRFLHRLTRHPADADDLLQETFLVVWRTRDAHERWDDAAAFLRTVAFRLYLSRRRRTARRRALAPAAANEPTSPPADVAVDGDDERRVLLARVRDAMDRLPLPLREAFDLYRVRGLAVREIAQMTGAPVKTVETRIRRATLDLARTLRPVARERSPSHE